MIPRKIHQIWIGDQSKKPTLLMETWKKNHPEWEYFLWSENEIEKINLINLYKYNSHPTLPGKSDIARYEILYRFGGFFVDADSVSIKPLDDLLPEKFVCCYESVIHRGNLVANGYIGCEPKSKCMYDMIALIASLSNSEIEDIGAWKTIGPLPFTRVVEKNKIKVMKQESFIPIHYLDKNFFPTLISHIDIKNIEEKCKLYPHSYSYQFWGSKSNY